MMIRRSLGTVGTLALVWGCSYGEADGSVEELSFLDSKAGAASWGLAPSTLSLGRWHACWALPSDGRLTCWGSDSGAVLGNGAMTADQTTASFVDTRALPDGLDTVWRQVAAGRNHTCGIT